MANKQKLAELLKAAFPYAKIEILGGVYDTVTLDTEEFILSDFDLKKMTNCATEAGYNGQWYITPKGERESNARHHIVFHR